MCTLTLVPRPTIGLRLMVNRDEQRTRPESLAPARVALGSRTALMPIDPISRGTWVGVNDAGLVACLLNRTITPEHAATFRDRASRGEIVPALLAAERIDLALVQAQNLDPTRWPPFRLFLVQRHTAAILASNGNVITIDHVSPLNRPLMLSSSGLGDELVRAHRERAFDTAARAHTDPLIAQQSFHSTTGHGHAALAPLMVRDDARTVSQTTIDLTAGGITLTHVWLNDALQPHREARETLSPSLSLLR